MNIQVEVPESMPAPTAPTAACVDAMDVLLAEAREALRDMHAGWRYIRLSHGDLYGVGWDRAETKAANAMAAIDAALAAKEQTQ
jgi:hypothetical protein